MYQDRTLTCRDCGTDFTFSASEQEFYAEKGFTNDPTRCRECRTARKANSNRSGGGSRPAREMFEATCSGCGGVAMVPFKPSGDKPVYCRDCFSSKNRY